MGFQRQVTSKLTVEMSSYLSVSEVAPLWVQTYDRKGISVLGMVKSGSEKFADLNHCTQLCFISQKRRQTLKKNLLL